MDLEINVGGLSGCRYSPPETHAVSKTAPPLVGSDMPLHPGRRAQLSNSVQAPEDNRFSIMHAKGHSYLPLGEFIKYKTFSRVTSSKA